MDRLTSACAEQAGVEQRIAAQTIRTMYGDTRAFASGEQSIDYLHGTVGPTVHLAVGGDGDAAHRVVCSGLDGY